METCKEREDLTNTARQTLSDILRCTDEIMAALDKGHIKELATLDVSLETAFGQKERAFGRLEQHRKDHGC